MKQKKTPKPGKLALAYFVWDTSVGDFEATYSDVAASGVRSVMLDARRGNLDLERRRDVLAAGRILRRLGLKAPACHGLYTGDCHLAEEDLPARRRVVRRHLNFMRNAAELGVKTYVIHVGSCDRPGSGYKRAALDRVRRALDELAPAAQSLGLTLALENGFTAGYLLNDAAETAAFVGDYAHPAVGVCYDSGHANICGGASSVLKTLAPHIVTMHLHDNDGRDDQHLLPGEGTIDWSELVPLISKCPRLIHVETEAANSRPWQFTKKVRPVAEVYRHYLKILNTPGPRGVVFE